MNHSASMLKLVTNSEKLPSHMKNITSLGELWFLNTKDLELLKTSFSVLLENSQSGKGREE